jgi:hypothetical protein
VPKLRIRGAIPPLPQYAFTACSVKIRSTGLKIYPKNTKCRYTWAVAQTRSGCDYCKPSIVWGQLRVDGRSVRQSTHRRNVFLIPNIAFPIGMPEWFCAWIFWFACATYIHNIWTAKAFCDTDKCSKWLSVLSGESVESIHEKFVKVSKTCSAKWIVPWKCTYGDEDPEVPSLSYTCDTRSEGTWQSKKNFSLHTEDLVPYQWINSQHSREWSAEKSPIFSTSSRQNLTSTCYMSPIFFSETLRGCNQKFRDWVDNEINNNKHSLRSNTKGYGGKPH